MVNYLSMAELGRTTLGSAGNTITVGSLPNKKWLMVLAYCLPSGGAIDPVLRINGDSGSNYALRYQINGTEGTQTSQTKIVVDAASKNYPYFHVMLIENVSTSNEKLVEAWSCEQNTAGAGTTPDRGEFYGKWSNTSNAIAEIDIITTTNNFATGSEVVVLGSDPSDTNVTPFFKKLGIATASGGETSLSISSFISKKYLICTNYVTTTSTSGFATAWRFNNDSAGNYANRWSQDGSEFSDSSITSIEGIYNSGKTKTSLGFIINITSQEKLVIRHDIDASTGAGNAPDRAEVASKWTNTSNQISRIDLIRSAGSDTLQSGSEIVVYGSD